MDYLIKFLARILVWLLDAVTWTLLQIMKLLMEGLLTVFNSIPVCPCFSTAASFMSSMPSSVAYFLSAFNFSAGIAAVLAGLVMRFLIRRIPFIG